MGFAFATIDIKTTFDVLFPNKGYTCFGTNNLVKKY